MRYAFARYLTLSFAYLCLLTTFSVQAESSKENKSFGKLSANLRYRIEQVNQDNLAKDSLASTLRSRIGFNTRDYRGISLFVEADDIRSIGNANYLTPSSGSLATSLGPKNIGQPIIADPLETELNQLYVKYVDKNTTAVLGRQRIIRGNARFVGNVGWRQHEQTYDGVSISNSSLKNLTIFAAYLSRRNTITFTDIDQDTLLIDANVQIFDTGILSLYYYDIKGENPSDQWENIGVRLHARNENLSYTLEISQQKNTFGEKPKYLMLEGAYHIADIVMAVGFENLGNDSNTSFATPLATLHKFNGWADQFLSTPLQGLEDKYLKIGGQFGSLNIQAILHKFDSDTSGIDLGSELDISVTRKLGKKISLGAKYADYFAGESKGRKTDVSKIWIWAEAKF